MSFGCRLNCMIIRFLLASRLPPCPICFCVGIHLIYEQELVVLSVVPGQCKGSSLDAGSGCDSSVQSVTQCSKSIALCVDFILIMFVFDNMSGLREETCAEGTMGSCAR